MTPQRGASDCTSADELQDCSNLTQQSNSPVSRVFHTPFVTNSHIFNNGTGRTSGKIFGAVKNSNIGGVQKTYPDACAANHLKATAVRRCSKAFQINHPNDHDQRTKLAVALGLRMCIVSRLALPWHLDGVSAVSGSDHRCGSEGRTAQGFMPDKLQSNALDLLLGPGKGVHMLDRLKLLTRPRTSPPPLASQHNATKPRAVFCAKICFENGTRMRVPRNPPKRSPLGSSKLHLRLWRKSKRVLLRLHMSGQTYCP